MYVTMRCFIQPVGRPKDEVSFECEYNPDVESLSAGTIEDIAGPASLGIQAALFNAYKLDRIVFSKWGTAPEQYDPENSRTFPMNLVGTRLLGTEVPIDEDESLFIRRDVTVGRTGKLYLLGAVYTDMIASTDGQWTLLPGPRTTTIDIVAALYTALTAGAPMVMIGKSLVETIYPATAEGEKQVPVKVYAATPHVRTVTGFTLVDVKARQRDQ